MLEKNKMFIEKCASCGNNHMVEMIIDTGDSKTFECPVTRKMVWIYDEVYKSNQDEVKDYISHKSGK